MIKQSQPMAVIGKPSAQFSDGRDLPAIADKSQPPNGVH
jgi:hypothetical protein